MNDVIKELQYVLNSYEKYGEGEWPYVLANMSYDAWAFYWYASRRMLNRREAIDRAILVATDAQ